MLNKFKSLNFVKKRTSPTETQIRKHREQTRIHKQWKNDLTQIRGVSSKLNDAYSNHKGDFALGRYEELKQMIKDAVKEYQEIVKRSHQHSLDGAGSAIASKYSGNQTSQGHGQSQGQSDAGGQKSGGLVSRLKQKAAALTGGTSQKAEETPTATKNDEKDQEMANWGYEGMNAKQVEEETETMRREVMQFKQDFRKERDRLDCLAKEYEESKKHTPPQRYTVLKYMIKDAVVGK